MKIVNSVIIAMVAGLLISSYTLEHKEQMKKIHNKIHHNKDN